MSAAAYWGTALRLICRNMLFMIPLTAVSVGCSLAAGVSVAVPDMAAAAVGAVAANLTRRPAREAILRRVAGRPRMTPADYRRTQELEAELGWEPSEPCAPVKVPAAVIPSAEAIHAAHERLMTATVAEKRALATEGALHFAGLARAGRESCASPCRLCEARDRHYPTPESRAALAAKLGSFEDDASLRNWIEKERWI